MSKFIHHSWDSVHSINLTNFDFHNDHLFTIHKIRGIVNHLMLRGYYLSSEELTFTLKFRENSLNKTYGNWTWMDWILSIKTIFQLLMCFTSLSKYSLAFLILLNVDTTRGFTLMLLLISEHWSKVFALILILLLIFPRLSCITQRGYCQEILYSYPFEH